MKHTPVSPALPGLTSPIFAKTSPANWIASLSASQRGEWLSGLDDATTQSLRWLWEFWALPHQRCPVGDWRTWLILGGRGAGKTRAGAQWVRARVEDAAARGEPVRIALVGQSFADVKEVMVHGESGIIAVSPPWFRPVWQETRKRLEWPDGSIAQVISAHQPESLRGPQFHFAWADELGKWRNPEPVWHMLQFGLRLGEAPQTCVTTTPRNVPLLRALVEDAGNAATHAPTEANAANLAPGFAESLRRFHGESALARQELDGDFVDAVPDALWSPHQIDTLRLEERPELDRIVIAVDPPVTGTAKSDDCGIIVAGAKIEGPPEKRFAVVLEDATLSHAKPSEWAQEVVRLYHRWGASLVVAEANQGGDLVPNMIRQVDRTVPVEKRHASRGKAARAEPVAAAYARGQVFHMHGLKALESQMLLMTRQGFEGSGSPDRVDALGWAIEEALLRFARSEPRASLRIM